MRNAAVSLKIDADLDATRRRPLLDIFEIIINTNPIGWVYSMIPLRLHTFNLSRPSAISPPNSRPHYKNAAVMGVNQSDISLGPRKPGAA